MIFKEHFHTYCFPLLMLFVSMGFCACNKDDVETPETREIKQPSFRIVINAQQNTSARSSRGPSAGEEGDGHWPAEGNESRVFNATLLFYQTEGNNGLNGTGEALVKYAVYAPEFNYDDMTNVYVSDTIRLNDVMQTGTYKVLAVCNLGDLSDKCLGKPLKEVRDMTTGSVLREAGNLENYHTFAMSSAKEVEQKIEGKANVPVIDGTLRVDLFNISLDVERLAARIDVSAGANATYGNTLPDGFGEEYRTNFERGYYRYNVGSAGDAFYLMAVTPTNLSDGEEYLFKRVGTLSQNSNGNYWNSTDYLGDEKVNSSGNADNYVIDPMTLQKTSATSLPAGLTYGETAYATLSAKAPEELMAQAGSYWVKENPADIAANDLFYEAKNGSNVDVVYRKWCYAKENTSLEDAPFQSYATGLLFSGYYVKHGSNAPVPKTYEYFIRHADPNNATANMMMKYGIVRNNIYRICVNGIASLGVIIIEVRNWTLINIPNIEM